MTPPYFSVKEAVFPFVKFPGVDTILGPEMKSTGEVMGVGKTFGEAFVKSQLGAGTHLPKSGKVFISVKNNDKARAVEVARGLAALGFELIATKGTAAAINAAGIACAVVNKVTEGRPHIVDMIKNNEIALVINTVEERRNAITDSRQIRTSALLARVTTFTTIFGAEAAVEGMRHMDELDVISIQEMHAQLARLACSLRAGDGNAARRTRPGRLERCRAERGVDRCARGRQGAVLPAAWRSSCSREERSLLSPAVLSPDVRNISLDANGQHQGRGGRRGACSRPWRRWSGAFARRRSS